MTREEALQVTSEQIANFSLDEEDEFYRALGWEIDESEDVSVSFFVSPRVIEHVRDLTKDR